MLEGIPQTIYGKDAAHADRLETVGGAVSVAAAAETDITSASAAQFGYMTYLRCDCTVASTTAGRWTLRLGTAGTIALLLQQPVTAAVVGSAYCWPFPVPWKTDVQGGVFTITPSVATMGTWIFICNGFHSSV